HAQRRGRRLHPRDCARGGDQDSRRRVPSAAWISVQVRARQPDLLGGRERLRLGGLGDKMAEAETENQALDVEALSGILLGRAIRQTFPLGPSILVTTAERDAIIAALERVERLWTCGRGHISEVESEIAPYALRPADVSYLHDRGARRAAGGGYARTD